MFPGLFLGRGTEHSGRLAWNLRTGKALTNYRNNGEISAYKFVIDAGLPALVAACDAIAPVKWKRLWLMAMHGYRNI